MAGPAGTALRGLPRIPGLLDDTIVMHVANLGAHYDASIIAYTA